MITAAWEEQRAIKEVMVFLQGMGCRPSLAVRIYKTYRDEAAEVVRREPYRLAGEVWGSGSRPPTRSPNASAFPTTAADHGYLLWLGLLIATMQRPDRAP